MSEPEVLKQLSAEEIATVAHGAITQKNREIDALRRRVAELESTDPPWLAELVEERIQELNAEAEAFDRDCINAATNLAEELGLTVEPDGWSEQDLFDAVIERCREAAQWQESSGQNYVRAERLREGAHTVVTSMEQYNVSGGAWDDIMRGWDATLRAALAETAEDACPEDCRQAEHRAKRYAEQMQRANAESDALRADNERLREAKTSNIQAIMDMLDQLDMRDSEAVEEFAGEIAQMINAALAETWETPQLADKAEEK
jgi:hypothetical protein